VDTPEPTPHTFVERASASTVFGILGPILIAATVGLALFVSSTPAPGQEFYAIMLYGATATYLTGLIWDLMSAAMNADVRRRIPAQARNYSSCLGGLLPLALAVVFLSAKADGQDWIFDWRWMLVVVLALTVSQFAIFAWISKVDRPVVESDERG